MTPQQAIAVVNQVRQDWQSTGKNHDAFREAVQVLQQAIQPKETHENGQENVKEDESNAREDGAQKTEVS